ncbi:MAG: glycosyltransferase family 39 protein [Chloroflexota bacterium]
MSKDPLEWKMFFLIPSPRGKMPRAMQINRVNVPLILILWLALALRLFQLETQSLWYDEGVTWYLTQFSLPQLVAWTAADIQPPFYYVILWMTTRLFGQSEWALRFPSLLFGVLNVPVMWQLGRALSPQRHRLVGYVAASFMTLSPLMVYYSQEARMYTLLVLQANVASYLLWQLMQGKQPTTVRILAYVLTMAFALYTHYFAAFLLLAHAIVWGVLTLGQGTKGKWLKQSAFLFLGVVVLFFPWLSVLLARLDDDPSYWPGVLKLNEIVQDVFISFAVGGKREMIFEADGLRFASVFGLLLLGCLALFWVHRRRASFSLVFLLAWLVIPVACILLLSYQTPKFNPRYTMMSWPAFALILAIGLNLISRHRLFQWMIQGIIYSFILYSWLFSLGNWFCNPASGTCEAEFARDDFRSVAQFIRERSFLNEPVLLSSGHFFPVWQYYFGSENWIPLPDIETLDISRVTGLDVQPTLAQALVGQDGVWLVTWQDEVIDPNQVIPLMLDVVGERADETNEGDELLIGQFWGVDLQYWHLPETISFPDRVPVSASANANFGDLVRLRGLRHGDTPQTDGILFWEALQPLTDDYQISMRLVDAENIAWGNAVVTRPGAYLYPTQRWPQGEIIAGRQALPWLPGTPPGDYWLEVGWLTSDHIGIDVLDESGNPKRRTVNLGPITLTDAIPGFVHQGTPLHEINGLALREAKFAVPTVESGSKVIVELVWQIADSDVYYDTVTILGWQEDGGQAWPLDEPISLDFSDVQPGTTFWTRHKLSTPYQVTSGPIRLQVQIGAADVKTAIAGLTLEPTERIFTPPDQFDITTEINFAGQTTLIGADFDQPILKPGESANLSLYWQADAPFAADYTVFVHPLGDDGTPVLNFDHAPPRPTSNWLEGEIIADAVTITIPPDFSPGQYPIEIGLYNTADPNYARLPVISAPDLQAGVDYVILTDLEVVAP